MKAETPVTPRRLIIEKNGTREIYEILEDSLVIGRDDSADLTLDDRKISRHHVEIRRTGSVLTVRDLESSNGTTVNGRDVRRITELHRGDVVGVGDLRIFIDAAGQAAPTPVVAAPAPTTMPPAPSEDAPAIGARGGRRSHRSSTAILAASVAVVLAVGWFIAKDHLGSASGDTSPVTDGNPPVEEVANGPDSPGTNTNDLTDVLPAASDPADLTRDFELAVLDERFENAWSLLHRLHQHRSGPLKNQLDAAMAEALTETVAEANRLKSSLGTTVASRFLNMRLKDFPDQSTAHTELTGLLLEFGPRPKRKPEVEVVNNDPSGPSASKVSSRDPAKTTEVRKPKPLATDVMDKAEKALDLGDAALRDRKLDVAASHFDEVVSLLESYAGPHRFRRRAERQLRVVGAKVAFVDGLVAAVGIDPSALGRIPHLPGQSGAVQKIDRDAIVFASQGKPVKLAWRVVPLRAMVAICTKARLDPKFMVDASRVLREYGAGDEADKILIRAVKRDKEQKPRIDQALADARHMPLPEQGFTLLDDKWFSPRELARKRLNDTIDAAVAAIEDDDPAARKDAIEVLMGLGDSARSSLHRALLMRKAILKERLGKSKSAKALGELGGQRTKLDEARDFALKLIFDTAKYPYPYRPPAASQEAYALYREHQPIVDERVTAVRKIWEDPREINLADRIHDIVKEIKEVNDAIRDAAFGEPTEDPAPWLMHLPNKGVKITIRNIANSAQDRQRIDTSDIVMAKNARSPSEAHRGESAQCRITNDYRIMMGRWAVRLYDPLIRASHGHCNDMSTRGFFSHTSPVEGKRTPSDRIRKEGMNPVGASENIAINGGPQGAHNAWVHSPGHHRNILGRAWRLMGPGNVGRYWCQNFCVSDRNADKPAEDEKDDEDK